MTSGQSAIRRRPGTGVTGMNRALLLAIRMSQHIASDNPAPMASPLIPAMTGFSQCTRMFITSWTAVSTVSSPRFRFSAGLRSAPAQNVSPTAVRPTTRTESSRAAQSTASTIARVRSGDSAFLRSGRFSLTGARPRRFLRAISARQRFHHSSVTLLSIVAAHPWTLSSIRLSYSGPDFPRSDRGTHRCDARPSHRRSRERRH